MALSVSAPLLNAQDVSAEDYRGFWLIRESAGDSCVINIKAGGGISAFWTGTKTNDIIKGKWTIEDNNLVARWESGLVEVFEFGGPSSLVRKSFQAGQPLTAQPIDEARATRLDPRQVGSLAAGGGAAPSGPAPASTGTESESPVIGEEATPAAPAQPARPAPLQSNYVGYWEIPQSSGGFMGFGGGSDHFYIFLSRSGEARTALRSWDESPGSTGRWHEENGHAYIEWSGGTKDILRQTSGGKLELATFNRKQGWSDKPRQTREAARSSTADAGRLFNAGEVQFLSVNDIRGRWEPVMENTSLKSIEIDGWGKARRTSPGAADMKGQWRLFSDYLVINWEDGSKDLLRPSARGFVREVYAPGVPLSSAPTNQEILIRTSDS